MPKVSVVIPTYNCSKYISDTIESVLNQTYHDFEIIIVDDGSTDNTKDILMQYDKKIRYFYQESKGVSAARNFGITKAKGDYVAFLDGDDIWLPEKLELQMPLITNNIDIGLVSTDGEEFDEKGLRRESITISKSPKKPNSFQRRVQQMRINDGNIIKDNLYEGLLLSNCIFTSSVLAKKKAIIDAGFFDETLAIAEDYDLWIRIAKRWPIIYLNKITAKYRVRNDGLSGGLDIRGARWERWEGIVLEKYLKNCHTKYKPLLKKRIYECFTNVAWEHFDRNEITETRRFCFRSLRYKKTQLKLYLYMLLSYFPVSILLFLRKIKRTYAKS